MWTLPSDPAAELEMDVAVANFVLSRNYDFAMVNDEKFKHMLHVARRVPPNFKPHTVARVSGELLCKLFDVNWNNETNRLLKDDLIVSLIIKNTVNTNKQSVLMIILRLNS
jgi:hypothetical protein